MFFLLIITTVVRDRMETTVNRSVALQKPFWGRERELSELAKMLNDPSCFLLTVTGIGGIGKSSLALKLANDLKYSFRDGICIVPLADLEHSGQVVPAILSRLGTAMSGADIAGQLFGALAKKSILLVLDNFDHLLNVTHLIEQIPLKAEKVKLLITSRTRLRVPGEFVFELTGMDTPDESSAEILSSAAMQLFISSSDKGNRLTKEELIIVARICEAVEGVPLGIELAASGLGRKTPLEILEEISGKKGLLFEEGLLQGRRHSSLRRVFDYSWQLLSLEEKIAFAELSVFRSGFDKEAAQFVAGRSETVLLSLCDKSLLRIESPGRYSMHSLLHNFSSVKLLEIPGRKEHLALRHAEYYCRILVRNGKELLGEGSSAAMDEVTRNLPEVRAAIHFSIKHLSGNLFLPASKAVMNYFLRSGLLLEGMEVFREAAAMLQDVNFQEHLGMKVNQALFAVTLAMYEEAAVLLEPAVSKGNQLVLTSAEFLMGVVFLRTGNMKRAEERMRRSLTLARAGGHKDLEATALCGLGDLYNHKHEADKAEIFMMQAMEINRAAGNMRDLFSNLITLSNLMFNFQRGDEAYQYSLESLECALILKGDLSIALAHVSIASALALKGELAQALENAVKATLLFEALNSRWGMQAAFQIKTSIESSLGLVEDSILSAERIIQLSEEIGGTYNSMESLITAGDVFEKVGNSKRAMKLYKKAHKIAVNLNTGTYLEKLNAKIRAIDTLDK
jgi:predicted ATPase